MAKAVIFDYGVGNLLSLKTALEKAGLDASIGTSAKELATADIARLPLCRVLAPLGLNRDPVLLRGLNVKRRVQRASRSDSHAQRHEPLVGNRLIQVFESVFQQHSLAAAACLQHDAAADFANRLDRGSIRDCQRHMDFSFIELAKR